MIDIEKYWQAVLAQDVEAIRPFFAPSAVINWHNTNESFTVDEFIRANCEYPGRWIGEVEKLVRTGDIIIMATHVHEREGGSSFHVVSFMKVRDGQIVLVDEYWGDDGLPPAWRQELHIGRAILP